MSYLIDLVAKVHDRQLAATQKGQESILGLLGRASETLDKAPKPLRNLPEGLKPVTSVVGSPSDYVRYAASSSKDWQQVRESFQDGLLALFASEPVVDSSASASAPSTTSKRSRSAKKA